MSRTVAALLLFFAASFSDAAELPQCFLGLWKSDEALTLADMQQHPEVTEKARSLFEKHFFGRLVLIFGKRFSGGYFEGEQARSELTLETHEIVEAGPNHAVLRTELMGGKLTSQWFCEGELIYTLVTKWEFREYFTRVP